MKFSARMVNGYRTSPQGPAHRAARRMSSAEIDLDGSGCIKQVDAPSWAEKTIYFNVLGGRELDNVHRTRGGRSGRPCFDQSLVPVDSCLVQRLPANSEALIFSEPRATRPPVVEVIYRIEL